MNLYTLNTNNNSVIIARALYNLSSKLEEVKGELGKKEELLNKERSARDEFQRDYEKLREQLSQIQTQTLETLSELKKTRNAPVVLVNKAESLKKDVIETTQNL